jgi:hypothetical protein
MDLKSDGAFHEEHARASHVNENGLLDLALVLVRQKKWVMYFLLISVGMGFYYAYQTSVKEIYIYTTQIEPVKLPVILNSTEGINDLGNNQIIESINTIASKLEYTYIPQVLSEYGENHPEKGLVNIKILIPADSNLLILESRGGRDSKDIHIKLHGLIVGKLLSDHTKIVKDVRKEMVRILDFEKLILEQLNSPAALVIKEYELEKSILNEIQEDVNKQKTVTSINKAKLSQQAKFMNREEVAMQTYKINKIQSLLDSIQGTDRLASMISTRLPSKSGKIVVMLSVMLGLFGGMVAAFAAEFIVNVRRQMLIEDVNKSSGAIAARPQIVSSKTADAG